jgi:hypothetical protein
MFATLTVAYRLAVFKGKDAREGRDGGDKSHPENFVNINLNGLLNLGSLSAIPSPHSPLDTYSFHIPLGGEERCNLKSSLVNSDMNSQPRIENIALCKYILLWTWKKNIKHWLKISFRS